MKRISNQGPDYYETLYVKDRDGVWFPAGDETYWFNSDEELFENEPDAEVMAYGKQISSGTPAQLGTDGEIRSSSL
jgi:hypothetical protein